MKTQSPKHNGRTTVWKPETVPSRTSLALPDETHPLHVHASYIQPRSHHPSHPTSSIRLCPSTKQTAFPCFFFPHFEIAKALASPLAASLPPLPLSHHPSHHQHPCPHATCRGSTCRVSTPLSRRRCQLITSFVFASSPITIQTELLLSSKSGHPSRQSVLGPCSLISNGLPFC